MPNTFFSKITTRFRISCHATLACSFFSALALSPTDVYALDCGYKASPPDAEIATTQNLAADTGVISAWYGGATTSYAHGVLGDAIEANTLYALKSGPKGCALAITLGNESVFEDVTPRIADVTGDGENNVITIESHQDKGASLAIYGIKNQRLIKIASTPHIGRANRWLAPVGIADFNGDKIKDVAYVQTPHIGGILKIWSFEAETPELLASKQGFSNHKIGQNYITGGLRVCGDRIEIILPDQNWKHTLIAYKEGNTIVSDIYANSANESTINTAMRCP